MQKKRLTKQIIAGLSTSLLLGIVSTNVSYAEEVATSLPTEKVAESPVVSPTTGSETATPTSTIPESEATPTNTAASTTTAPVTASTATSESSITLAPSTVYMTKEATLTDALTGDAANKTYTWTLDGKPLTQWHTWDADEGGFTTNPLIKNIQIAGNQLTVSMDAFFGKYVDQRYGANGNTRRTYRDYMKEYTLKGVSADGTTITKIINIRPYENFHTHDEMLTEIEETKNNAASNRQVTIETIGTSAQNREIKMGIIAENQHAIDEYLNQTEPAMLKSPDELIAALRDNRLTYRVPILFNNTHADEQPGIDIITGLFKEFATKDTIQFDTTNESGAVEHVTFSVPDLLKKFIFLFNFTENPDGDVLNTRALANGMDPNRDASFQTNPETRAITAQINKWNPIALLDFHGYVSEFLIEPSTPPHDQNYEYDLFGKNMIAHAAAMGRAGVHNSEYTSYLTPLVEFLKGEQGNPDYNIGWDDGSSVYTGVYAIYHGILGHTLEIPHANQESYKAGFFAALGSLNYLNTNRDQLFENKLQFFSRGIHKVETPEAEKDLLNPDQSIRGRNKKDNPKFFPDYYIIPVDPAKDIDADQAFAMVDYFKRNGVEVKELAADTGDFKKGSLVIDMAQAKRGYANHILYSGNDESIWPAMYAEVIANFPDLRGFKAVPVFNEKAFDGALTAVTRTTAPRIVVDKTAPYYFVSNNSLSTIQAVNEAIRAGEKVYTADDGYIVSTNVFEHMLTKYSLYGEPLRKKPVGETLTAIKVYAPGNPNINEGYPSHAEVNNSLKQMGFDTVDTIDEADVLILDNGQFDASILGKKPTIIMGGSALRRLEKLNVIAGFDAERTGSRNEGLLKVTVDDMSPLASGYFKDDLFYSNSGSWIQGVPEGFKPVITAKDKDFYISGWWPGHEKVAGKVLAINGEYNKFPLFIYAGNPTNKLHTLHFYRWVSNMLLNKEYATLQDIVVVTPPSEEPTTQVVSPQKEPSKSEQQLPHTGEDVSTVPLLAGFMSLMAGIGLTISRKKQ